MLLDAASCCANCALETLEPFAVAASGFECAAWSDAAEDGCCCCIEEENGKPADCCCRIYAAAPD